MTATHSWSIETRAIRFEIRNDRAGASGSDHVVNGEVVNLEPGVMAPYLWKNGTAGAASPVFSLRVDFLDSAGAKVVGDFCVTPHLVALKSGGGLPFRCSVYDPDSRIAGHVIVADMWSSLPLLWSVAPYEIGTVVSNASGSGGLYQVDGTFTNPGARSFGSDAIIVVVTAYRAGGTVVGHGWIANPAPIGPASDGRFAISIDDPTGEIVSHKVTASIFHP
jgi:hypothetical protein